MSEIRTVLCPVDFSELCDRSQRLAIEVCQSTGAKLVLHHNLDVRPPNFMSVTWMWSEEHEREEEEKAAQVPEQLEKAFARVPDGVDYEGKVTRGPLDAALLMLAQEVAADLVVMGSRGASDSEHQSLTELIIVKAGCPVLTIEDECGHQRLFPPEGEAKVVVPIDFTPRSRAALDYALSLGEKLPLELHLLHVVKPAESTVEANAKSEEIESAEERLQALVPDEYQGSFTSRALAAKPTEGIRKFACEIEADFVIMASHGKNLLQRWMSGTTTLDTLHGSDCPVWFVPGAWGAGS